MHLHCDRKHVAGCCHSHAGCEYNLLAVTMKNAVIWIPGSRQGERNVYLLVGFSAFEKERRKEGKLFSDHKSSWATIARIRKACNWLRRQHYPESVPLKSPSIFIINTESKKKFKKQQKAPKKFKTTAAGLSNLSCPQKKWDHQAPFRNKYLPIYKWIHACSENSVRK